VVQAEEALRMGLVDRVVPADALAGDAAALGAELAGRAPVAIRQAKRVTRAAAHAAMATALAHEVDAFATTFASEDCTEGLRAFLEKRVPVWKGR
jgi:enoyl-CoA hydratase